MPLNDLSKQPKMITWKTIIHYIQNENLTPNKRVEKSDEEWMKQLTEEEFYVTRKKGTERPFSGENCTIFEPGIYACKCCGETLFDASEKFDSGTGWPSFNQPIQENAIAYIKDASHSMVRVEVICNCCDAHLGHVFPDGPPPSNLRYCINDLSLQKI